jgi:hypothetical protein
MPDSIGNILDFVEPSKISLILNYTGSITAFVVAGYALGYAALTPGVVTFIGAGSDCAIFKHRIDVQHDIPIDLDLIPGSLANIPHDAGSQADATIIYFSFVTLTSTGFGEIVPVHPLIRTLANVKAIIGQLYPATLLARLITLELGRRRQ